jgi:hypothetical protein
VATGTCSTRESRGSVMRRKNGRKTRERWSSPKGGNSDDIAAKSGGVGGALVSRCGREVEGGEGEGVARSCRVKQVEGKENIKGGLGRHFSDRQGEKRRGAVLRGATWGQGVGRLDRQPRQREHGTGLRASGAAVPKQGRESH